MPPDAISIPPMPGHIVSRDPQGGMTSEQASQALKKLGPNAMLDTAMHSLHDAIDKFWAPVPWMLEAAILLELVLGKYVEGGIIAALLVFNAALGLFQESLAQATLAALRSRLALNASVRCDGAWKIIPAAGLVPGDIIKLSLGGVVAADIKLTSGEVLLDQSMLTGESFPIEAGAGLQTFAGALVRRGEAVPEVTVTGIRTKFGLTAELVRTAHVVSSQQKAVLLVVRYLAAFNGAVIVIMVGYAWFLKMPFAEIIVLTAILASIPVALPATFTLASALGARALARLNVLPTRLSAVDEAATMDVLCADKTGTLTRNELTLAFITLVFVGQATIYAIRGHRNFLDDRPSFWLALSSVADIAIASTLAIAGIATTFLPVLIVAGTFGAALAFAVVLDIVKMPLFAWFGIA
jgi:H+-transporting ATPase